MTQRHIPVTEYLLETMVCDHPMVQVVRQRKFRSSASPPSTRNAHLPCCLSQNSSTTYAFVPSTPASSFAASSRGSERQLNPPSGLRSGKSGLVLTLPGLAFSSYGELIIAVSCHPCARQLPRTVPHLAHIASMLSLPTVTGFGYALTQYQGMKSGGHRDLYFRHLTQ